MTYLDPVFFSTYPYAACKLAGPDAWPAQLKQELANPSASEWPCWRTFDELLHVCSVDLYADGSTYITRARSVATAHYLRSDKDVWLTCDDDIYASREVLRKVILACRATRGGIALPYLNRDAKSMTFRKVSGPTVYARPSMAMGGHSGEHLPLRSVDRVGFGLVALHREMVDLMAKDAPHFSERDKPNGVRDCPALFLEGVFEGSWVGEDYYFSAHAERAGRPMHVLLDAPCTHQGMTARLDVEGRIQVADARVAKTLNDSLRAREKEFAALTCETEESQGG